MVAALNPTRRNRGYRFLVWSELNRSTAQPLNLPMLYHLTTVSANTKTGLIPVSTSSADLCPTTCPFRAGGCYAASGPLALHWREVTANRRGDTFTVFLDKLRSLAPGTLFRHNQAGDIKDPKTAAGRRDLTALVDAVRHLKGFTYTHHRLTPLARTAIKAATANGFTVNVSTETIDAADAAVSHGLRAVTVVPSTDTRRVWLSPDGNHVLTCPAQVHDGMTCQTCRLCHARPQTVIIAFRAHGSSRRRVDSIIGAASDA